MKIQKNNVLRYSFLISNKVLYLHRIYDEEKRGQLVPSFYNQNLMREKVTPLLNEALKEHTHLFLIDMEIASDNKITVIIDGDEGVRVEDCIAISRAIEHNLDREEEDFSIDVFSAGVSRPLSMPRQYKKNIGRTLQLKTTQGETIEGEITEATDNEVTLEWKAREPKPVGKGKVTVQKKAVLPYTDIVEAKVMVIFN
ncbi:MAG: ribosome maturation factor RimP [Flavobacteriales bacterium]|jgi:ribosome maturation factor RimP